jgi:uncharacterized membrane protein YqhA
VEELAPGGERAPRRGVAQRIAIGFQAALRFTRYVMLVPVIILLFASLGAFFYSVVVFIDSVRAINRLPFPPKGNISYFVLSVDVLLIGATLFIAAVGFFELFVPFSTDEEGDKHPWRPDWLAMRDLNDLKARIVSMLVLVSVVSFVDVLVKFTGGPSVIYAGGGVALTVGALTLYLRFGTGDHR